MTVSSLAGLNTVTWTYSRLVADFRAVIQADTIRAIDKQSEQAPASNFQIDIDQLVAYTAHGRLEQRYQFLSDQTFTSRTKNGPIAHRVYPCSFPCQTGIQSSQLQIKAPTSGAFYQFGSGGSLQPVYSALRSNAGSLPTQG